MLKSSFKHWKIGKGIIVILSFNEISILDVAKLCNIKTEDSANRIEIVAHCPFCSGGRTQRPTASINKYKNLFYCHRCGEGFNSISLFAKIYGIENKQAYNELRILDNAS